MVGILSSVVAETVDPATVRPSPLSSVVFVFLAVALILLLWSMVRHLRRAQDNLGSARTVPEVEIPTIGGPGTGADAAGATGLPRDSDLR